MGLLVRAKVDLNKVPLWSPESTPARAALRELRVVTCSSARSQTSACRCASWEVGRSRAIASLRRCHSSWSGAEEGHRRARVAASSVKGRVRRCAAHFLECGRASLPLRASVRYGGISREYQLVQPSRSVKSEARSIKRRVAYTRSRFRLCRPSFRESRRSREPPTSRRLIPIHRPHQGSAR